MSYVDHSNFLLEGKNYQSLFEYDRTDYESWAYGLKRCGYATDPDYATKLIKLIEKYQLSQFDQTTK
jgi:flagellum-specific peptidoglycan hydrolase FlgJ